MTTRNSSAQVQLSQSQVAVLLAALDLAFAARTAHKQAFRFDNSPEVIASELYTMFADTDLFTGDPKLLHGFCI